MALRLSCKNDKTYYTPMVYLYLVQKIHLKHKQYPNEVDVKLLKRVKKLTDFDEYYTSQLNGFKDARDYYSKASCKQFLPSIKKPSLLINALDDPFLSPSCFPYEEAETTLIFIWCVQNMEDMLGLLARGSIISLNSRF